MTRRTYSRVLLGWLLISSWISLGCDDSVMVGKLPGRAGSSGTYGGAVHTSGTTLAVGGTPASATGGSTMGGVAAIAGASGRAGLDANGGSFATGGGAATGGVSAATGGAPAATGGVSVATGGAPAATGGVSAATGGAPAATGGVSVATGGAPAATGGVSVATGGAPAATGGAPNGDGGATIIGGAAGNGGTFPPTAGGPANGGTAGSSSCGIVYKQKFEVAVDDNDADLFGVHGSSGTNVWAVGEKGTVLHWDGWRWTLSPVKVDGTLVSSALTAVWVFGPADVWAVGHGGTVVHFDGVGWSKESSGTNANLVTLRGIVEGDLWAAGEGGTILHRTSGSWVPVAPDGVNESMTFTGIWGDAAYFDAGVWIIGTRPEKPNAVTLVNWLPAGPFMLSRELESTFACSTPATVHPINMWGHVTKENETIVAFGVWTAVHCHETPESPPTGGGIVYIDAMAAAAKSMETPPFSARVKGLWSYGASNAWVVGYSGTVAHFDGSWTECDRAGDSDLNAIWGSTRDDLWVVGEGMTIRQIRLAP